jgi:FkbM family methyltransferase
MTAAVAQEPALPAMKTIFDFGLHEGFDTEFYLKKGFRVVAVDASPQFRDAVRRRFADEIGGGRLIIIDKAIAERAGEAITFYVRTDKDGWSSIDREIAERDGIASTPLAVETTTTGELIAAFGVPHYLKCDIEGADNLVLAQLSREARKPPFISAEAEPRGDEIIDLLASAGYKRFQIINQGCLHLFKPPDPPREGFYVAQRFHGKMSGLFGEELPQGLWTSEREIRRRLALWQRLASGETGRWPRSLLKKYGRWTRRTWLIGNGWIDIHARLDG